MEEALSHIRSSVIDGRAETPRFRQRQLAALHATLIKSKNDILAAIINDSHHTRYEAEAQYHLTPQALKSIYLQLDPLKMIATEYSISHGKDNANRRVPFGCAHIIPSQTSLFYSSTVPVAAAISAGNCVVLELPQTLSELSSLLKKLLSYALDRLTFLVVNDSPFDKGLQDVQYMRLDGTPKSDATSGTRAISTPLSRVAAMVDRTANLQEAAKDLVRARFSFGGESAYAPDLVLVDEFAVKQLCTAVSQAALSYLTSSIDAHSNGSAKNSTSGKQQSTLQKDLEASGATVLASGARGTLALLPSTMRSNEILTKKITEPLLLIHPVSSLDDAIDYLNSTSTRPLLAAHIFAAPDSAKYLSHFVIASASFVNGIPAELLVGPAAPEGFALSVSPRYTVEMFSMPHPEIFKYSSDVNSDVALLLDGSQEISRRVRTSLQSYGISPCQRSKKGQARRLDFSSRGFWLGLELR